MTESAAPRAKLSCRNMWKVFGPAPHAALESCAGVAADPAEVKTRLQASGHFPAVMDVSFDVMPGEIFIIMGLSGSGKSTLVRCLSRLVEPTGGKLLLDGEDLLAADRKRLIELRRHAMGMVFQNFGLLPHLTVRENVAFPLKVQGVPTARASARVSEMISLVGLAGREDSLPHQLSGGQQQRVGIARSLAVGPELWFLDEPFSALDPLIRRQMQDEFLRLQSLLKKTIIFITHDIGEAFRLGDRIAIMRDGEVIQLGTPAEIVLRPVDAYVAEFTEELSLTRVITAGDLAAPDVQETAGAPAIAATTPLDDLIPQIAGGTPGFAVHDDKGGLLGQLQASRIIDVLRQDRARRRT